MDFNTVTVDTYKELDDTNKLAYLNSISRRPIDDLLSMKYLDEIIPRKVIQGRNVVARVFQEHKFRLYTKVGGTNLGVEVLSRNIDKDVIEEIALMDEILDNQCVSTEIELKTGNLVFANHFHPYDEMDLKPPHNEYQSHSLCSYTGRKRTMDTLATENKILYGQVGNTSVSVYKVDNDTLNLVRWEDDEYDCIPKSWKKMGRICCDVWRFEFIEKEVLDSYKTDNNKEYVEDIEGKVSVTPGTWKLNNYYHHLTDEQIVEKFNGVDVIATMKRIK